MKFGFVAKHRRIWPAEWLCEALGVSRGGFYAWLTRSKEEIAERILDEQFTEIIGVKPTLKVRPLPARYF